MGDAAVEEQTSVPSDAVDETVEPGNELDRAIEELNGLSEAMGPPAGQSSGTAPHRSGGTAAGDFILDIPIDIHVIIGSTELTVAELLALEGGKVIALNRRIGEPVDIMVNGRNIAKGEITVMEDDESRFGIKITGLIGNQA